MGFELIIKGTDAPNIAKNLYQLLDEVSDAEVLKIDKEFDAALDKHSFLAQFESVKIGEAPKRDSHLLERWTHYRWLRLELLYLANQRAILNRSELVLPKVDSVNQAIIEAKEAGASLPESLEVLRKVKLQIVSTEHPTDPLSQFTRDTLTKIAIVMESETEDPATKIRGLLQDLQKADAIPRFQRSVMDEVNRNINTLERLYDNVPDFVQSVLSAYKTHYGESYYEHEEELWQALESGIILDASWAGFDADGNDNVTPQAMNTAIRLHRIRAAEKHILTLNSTVAHESKLIEHKLRNTLFSLNEQVFNEILDFTSDKKTLQWIHSFQNTAGRFLSLRCYQELIAHYKNLEKEKLELPESVLTLFSQQVEIAQKLQELAAFSGSNRAHEHAELRDGTLQKFQKKFKIYLDTIRSDASEFELQSKEITLHPGEFFVKGYEELLATYSDFLTKYPSLKTAARIFGVQLRSFGMTYGAGHIRQDSSVFVKFWSAILDDLGQDPSYQKLPIFKLLKDRKYEELSLSQRMQVQKLLINGSAESELVLKVIYAKHNNCTYLNGVAYQNADFACVRRELERFELACRHKDMIENVIISNCESAANIFEVEALLRIFPNRNKQLKVVPLLEKRQDLENYEIILLDYLKFIIQEQLNQVIPDFEQLTTRTELHDFISENPQRSPQI